MLFDHTPREREHFRTLRPRLRLPSTTAQKTILASAIVQGYSVTESSWVYEMISIALCTTSCHN